MRYQLKTSRGDYVIISADDQLAQCRKPLQDSRAVELWTHADAKRSIMVSGSPSRPFSLSLNAKRAAAHAVNTDILGDGISILDLWTRSYIYAPPIEEGNVSPLIPARMRASRLEKFHTTRLEDPHSASEQTMTYLLPCLEAGTADPSDVIQALQLGEALPRLDIVISIMCQLMSWEHLKEFARALLKRQDLLETLQRVYATDIWAETALPSLAEWLTEGRPKQPCKMRVSDNWLGKAPGGFRSRTMSTPHLISTFARRSVAPKKQSCLIATARNEGIYLLEWVAYHKAIGFEHIIIYSNDNTDGSDALLSALAESGEIVWIDNVVDPGENAQDRAYAHALSCTPHILDYEWILFLDLDEFFAVQTGIFDGLSDFLNWHSERNSSAIAVNWQVVGPSKNLFWNEKPLTRRLGSTIEKANRHVKSFVRASMAISQQPHFPRFEERTMAAFVASNGGEHIWDQQSKKPGIAPAYSANPSISHAVVFHYFLKSRDEFIWKLSRNRGNYAVKKDGSFSVTDNLLKIFNSSFAKAHGNNLKIMESMCPDLDERIQKLRNIHEIGIAEYNIIENYMRSIDQLRNRFYEYIFETWPEAAKYFMATTGPQLSPSIDESTLS